MFKQIGIILTLTLSGVIIPSTNTKSAPTAIAQPDPLTNTATESETSIPPKTLKVGVAGSAPFVMNHSLEPTGISVEIWEEVALRSQLDYQLIPLKNVKTGIEAIRQNQLDVLIGPISITAERLETVNFTQPYFRANIGLLINSNNPTIWSRVKPLFQIAIISSIGVFFLAIFIVGNLIWLAEHRRNDEQFPKAYLPGIISGMWFALVTLTTVGYGDKAPVTKIGKIITSVWMILTMVAASSLTAGIASALTIFLTGETTEKFVNTAALKNTRIAVVDGTTGQGWAEAYNARLIPTLNLEGAIKQVLQNKAEGVVFDVPALKYYLSQNPELPLKIADIVFASENYGFVLPMNSSLVNEINVDLIALQEEGKLEFIQNEILDTSLDRLEQE